MDIALFILSVTTFANIFLAILIFSKNIRLEANRRYLYMGITVGLWELGSLTIFLATEKSSAIYCIKVLYSGLIFIPVVYFHLILHLIDEYKGLNKRIAQVGYLLGSILLLFNWAGVLVKDIIFIAGRYIPVGLGKSIFCYMLTIYGIYGIYVLLDKYRTTTLSVEKNRLTYILTGIGIASISLLLNFVLSLKGIVLYPVVHIGILGLNIMIANCLVRFRLLDIRILIRRGIMYAIFVGILTGILICFILSTEKLEEYPLIIYASMGALIITFILQPLQERIPLLIDRIFFHHVHIHQELLKKITKEICSCLDKHSILALIFKTFKKAVPVDNIVVMLLDINNKDKYQVYYPKEVEGKDTAKQVLILTKEEIMHNWFLSECRGLTKDEVITNPDFKHDRAKFQEVFDKLCITLLIPLIFQNKLIGIIGLGDKINGEGYYEHELSILSALCNEIAIGLENTRLYENLKHYAMELELANKAKSNFLTIVSHELRTPLTVMLGYISLLKQNIFGELTSGQYEGINIIERKARELNELIEDILDLAKIKKSIYPVKHHTTNIREAIEKAIERYTVEAEKKNIKITVSIPETLPLITFSAQQIKDIFFKLIDNAIKFNKVNGNISIIVIEEPEYLRCEIIDTGIGIAQEDIPKIFEPFYQVDTTTTRRYEGMGLGLSIVKEVIEAYKGKIKIESIVGQGTRVILFIPKEKDVPQQHIIIPQQPKKVVDKVTILIGEEDIEILKLHQMHLTSKGYHVLTATDGLELLDKAYNTNVSLIFVNLWMPKIEGYEIYSILERHRQTKDIPVVLFLPEIYEENLITRYNLKHANYLLKPFEPSELEKKINEMILVKKK
jgi:signal transduction histidine kinase/CheY-like chemotaxis protein